MWDSSTIWAATGVVTMDATLEAIVAATRDATSEAIWAATHG